MSPIGRRPLLTALAALPLAGGLTAGLIASATDNNVAQSAAAGALAGMASCGIQGMPPCR